MFAARIATKPLVGLCRRMSISLEAGIDLRTVLKREADRAHGALRRHLLAISAGINQGQSLAEALAETDNYFPSLLRAMVRVAEETGHLDAVLAQMAEHYQNQLAIRRQFWSAITWPLVQLGIALVVVGFLIWFMGFVRELHPESDLDLLGFGLVGPSGLTIYVAFLAAVGAAFWFVRSAVSRGLVWARPIQRLVLRIPGIGKALETLALARLAWSLNVTMNAGMDVRRALRLSLRSTQNARYLGHIPVIDREILQGNSLYGAFSVTGEYPVEFLDTLAVGEESGQVVESMGTLARLYQEQARAALATLAVLAGWAVWAAIAVLIIALIFRLFSFYVGVLNGAMPQ